ncbi:hypothetical protein [Actinophytocola sp.]|uniref:hypothetical protein n=1 Tax=Actinophytocola sp. TaxID=1872138 RepID=UPI003D6B92EC
MTTPGDTTMNFAGAGATVGMMADEVHDSNVYFVHPEATPDKKYEVGVRYLDDGVPFRARDLIHEAIAHGYDTAEVRFHWALAMLSKRAYRDLSTDEREALGRLSEHLRTYADDEWKRALEAIRDLLDSLNRTEGDSGPAVAELRALPFRQREKINRHLDLVLTGGWKDRVWADTRQAAEDAQYSGQRTDRVWAYFQPKPSPPRVRPPDPISTAPGDVFRAVISSSLFVIAVFYLGWSVLRLAAALPILAYVLMVAAGVVAARSGLVWHYRAERLRAKDLDYFGLRGVNRAPEGGFAGQVSKSFAHYSEKYGRAQADHERWLTETAGIRNTLRNEVVEIYREQKVSVGQIRWLIRFLVWDVRKRWQSGTLWDYREQYRITPATKMRCSFSVVAMIIAAVGVVVPTIQAAPLSAAVATFVALVTAPAATARWLQIRSEHRRFDDEVLESDRLLEIRQEAYQRWKHKLDSKRPSEGEMETWVNHDRTMILDDALRLYRLAWRDIIAHAFLQTPARGCKRAMVVGGVWRYSKYDIRLFLITQDGVREVSTELDFEQVVLNGQERNNYRFDAVSSVHVARRGRASYTLELTLTNGPTRNIRVLDSMERQSDHEEHADTFSRINLDSAGFTHTLHILEGIAAEGKGWINRDPRTNGNGDGTQPTES